MSFLKFTILHPKAVLGSALRQVVFNMGYAKTSYGYVNLKKTATNLGVQS
jgi:hypothetical protein